MKTIIRFFEKCYVEISKKIAKRKHVRILAKNQLKVLKKEKTRVITQICFSDLQNPFKFLKSKGFCCWEILSDGNYKISLKKTWRIFF